MHQRLDDVLEAADVRQPDVNHVGVDDLRGNSLPHSRASEQSLVSRSVVAGQRTPRECIPTAPLRVTTIAAWRASSTWSDAADARATHRLEALQLEQRPAQLRLKFLLPFFRRLQLAAVGVQLPDGPLHEVDRGHQAGGHVYDLRMTPSRTWIVCHVERCSHQQWRHADDAMWMKCTGQACVMPSHLAPVGGAPSHSELPHPAELFVSASTEGRPKSCANLRQGFSRR